MTECFHHGSAAAELAAAVPRRRDQVRRTARTRVLELEGVSDICMGDARVYLNFERHAHRSSSRVSARLLWRGSFADTHQVVRTQPLAERGLHSRGVQGDVVSGRGGWLIERQAELGA